MKREAHRRDWLAGFLRPFQAALPKAGNHDAGSTVAVVLGRQCLALTSFCASCFERCPVAGAMRMDHGMPMVNPELCTGCGVCHAVCPAPVNAIRLLPRRPRQASANPALAT